MLIPHARHASVPLEGLSLPELSKKKDAELAKHPLRLGGKARWEGAARIPGKTENLTMAHHDSGVSLPQIVRRVCKTLERRDWLSTQANSHTSRV